MHSEKLKNRKKPAATRGFSQNSGGIGRGPHLADNRPGASAQRKLSNAVNASLEIAQLKTFQVLANENPGVKNAARVRALMNPSFHRPPLQGVNGPVQRVKTIAVDQASEQLLQDSGQSTATRQAWRSKFVIYVYNGKDEAPRIRVIIRLITGADDKVFQTWNASIMAAWNNKFSIRAADGAVYPITVEILRGDADYSDHTVENVKADKSLAGRGLFGTDHMLRWGEADPQDIPHEVGHMIGNQDEYGTVDGRNFDAEYDILNPDTHSIMRRGDQPPRMRHFGLILEKVQESGDLGADPKLIKYHSGRSALLPAQKPMGKAPAKAISKSSAGGEAPLRIGGPAVTASAAQIGASAELRQVLHARRVEAITAYVMANIDTLTLEQDAYLSSHDWNGNPDYSAAAKRILGL